MATRVYPVQKVTLFDGTTLEISQLKIKYFRELLDTFENIKYTKTDDEALVVLLECTRICLQQFYPEISHSIDQVEDNLDLDTMHVILDVAGGIKLGKQNEDSAEDSKSTGKEDSDSWDKLDLVKLESEIFAMGNWKNFDDLESSLNMSELIQLVSSRRELDYEEKKFFAAIQGVDLDKGNDRGQKEWEDLKARVFSKGKATDSKDILALQGENARQAGFGIGFGLEYEDLRSPS